MTTIFYIQQRNENHNPGYWEARFGFGFATRKEADDRIMVMASAGWEYRIVEG